jgi:electron transfer flavoprotein beta subunit
MNIIVCAKQVVDVAEIKIDASTKKPILVGVPQKISDMDKNALEEAIKIKEKHGGKITILTVGAPDAKERIKELLAMGADEGALVSLPEKADYHVIAHLLADMFSSQMGPQLAGLLNIPQMTYAQTITVENNKVISERNLGEKAVTMESPFPVLLTVTKESNTPRLPSLMAILASSSKPIHEWPIDQVTTETLHPKVQTIDIKGIPMQRKNIIYQEEIDLSVTKLVDELGKIGVLR